MSRTSLICNGFCYTTDTAVYYGPSSYVYDTVEQLQADTIVFYLGYKDSNNEYALIEFTEPGSGVYQRAFINANTLSVNRMYKYETFKYNAAPLTTIPPKYPMGGAIVTQGFNDTNTDHKGHLGYDLSCDEAEALFAGRVVGVIREIVTNTKANGRVVCLEHNINGKVFYSAYCHLASVYVDEGDYVAAREKLGLVGGSGFGQEDAYGKHVHVCVFTGEKTVAPMGYCGEEKLTFEECSEFYRDNDIYCYGPYTSIFPGCDNRCFYDPYGVVSTNADVIYNRYDVNYDYAVNQLDVTRAQRYYGTNNPICDFDEDGEVTITDIILITNNYSE